MSTVNHGDVPRLIELETRQVEVAKVKVGIVRKDQLLSPVMAAWLGGSRKVPNMSHAGGNMENARKPNVLCLSSVWVQSVG